jgi:hypothetical protein
MTDQTSGTDGGDDACWQCGAPAKAGCAYVQTLFANSRRHLDAPGYTVIRGTSRDKLRIAVPRCAACRARGQDAIAISFASMIAGAILAPILRSMFWPHFEPPRWLHLGHQGPLGTASAIGLVLGLLVAVPCIAWSRRRRGLRALNTYPALLALRRAGWYPPRA